jgi:hypothetical protein
MEVVNALLRGTIELKRAELILRALNTAVRNIKRVKFDLHSDEMVRLGFGSFSGLGLWLGAWAGRPRHIETKSKATDRSIRPIRVFC